ncbi:MAG: Gfo/Idh/MocA family oxidoreductase [Verrucomicrobia bacterium]|nr:Gfo/Idh/MocA family oxidoreductase [Verrucomicrobiota bacterium]
MKLKRENTVRYAVVGLGYISQTAALPAFGHTESSQLVALISGDDEKRRELGNKYSVPTYDYDKLEEAIRKEQIEALYIATPNTLHREYVERAARQHVHSLCEKPMATTEADCRAMIRAAQENGVKLMIAYRLHFADSNVEAVELAKSGKLGELRIFQSLFSMQVTKGNPRIKLQTGGGTLYDIGIYCINAARYLFQDEPEEVYGISARGKDERFVEVEEMVSGVLRFPGERLAAFTCSFGAADNAVYDVVGTKGTLRVESAYEYSIGSKWKITVGEHQHERSFAPGDQFAAELDYFSDCILTNREPEPSGMEGLADIRIINALYESTKTKSPVRVERIQKEQRPGQSQEIKREPPGQPPELIHVRPAHS